MSNTLRVPSVHLNGTSKEGLILPLNEVVNNLYDAIRALDSDGAPNARDYYVQGAHAFAEAQAQHRARVAKLSEVRAELCEILEHIHDS